MVKVAFAARPTELDCLGRLSTFPSFINDFDGEKATGFEERTTKGETADQKNCHF
jgi:hypothetical protein